MVTAGGEPPDELTEALEVELAKYAVKRSSYVGISVETVTLDQVLDIIGPLIRAHYAAALEGAREDVARAIEAKRNEHWQRHLRDHPLADGKSCPGDYAAHDAYYDAAKIARAARLGVHGPTTKQLPTHRIDTVEDLRQAINRPPKPDHK